MPTDAAEKAWEEWAKDHYPDPGSGMACLHKDDAETTWRMRLKRNVSREAYRAGHAAGVAQERERCAGVAEDKNLRHYELEDGNIIIAAAIREGEK